MNGRSTNPIEPITDATVFKLYKIRFLMLAIFCFGSAMNGYSSQFIIIFDVVQFYYNVGDNAASWMAIISVFGFLIGAIPAIWLFQNYGLRATFLTGMVGSLVGYCMLCGAINRSRFWLVMFSQGVIALFQPAFLNLSPLIAFRWFGENEVSKACSVGALSNIIGSIISSVVTPSVISIKTVIEIESGMYKLFLYQAGVFTLGTIFALIVFKETPSTPPCLTQAIVEENALKETSCGTIRVVKDMYGILKNPDFVLITISFSISFALGAVIIAHLNQFVIELFPLNVVDVGYIAISIQLTGCLAMVISGAILDKTRKYKTASLIVYFGITSSIFLLLCTYPSNLPVIYVAFSVFGMFSIPFLSMGMEIAAEIAYPLPTMTSCTLVIFFGNLAIFILIQIIEWILTDYDVVHALNVCLLFAIMGFFTLSISQVKSKFSLKKQITDL